VFVNLRVTDLSPDQETQPQIKDENRKCGFGLVSQIKLNIEKFTPVQQSILKTLLQRPIKEANIVSPSGLFRIHYDYTGNEVPNYDSTLSVDENVLQVALAIDSAYKFEVDFLEYSPPPSDNGEGGDDLYDIYISSTGNNYGYTEPESPLGNEKYTSFIVIHNSFTNFFTKGLAAMRVTVAHELHHSIQMGNYILRWEDRYFHEITSTAMEEFVFDDVNDYYNYNPSYFRNPETPLPLTTGYNTATWNIFLRDNFDYDIIKRQWELMPSVRAMFAINTSIFEYGSSFSREYNRYGIWMYFTNYRAVPGKYFEEGVNYPLVDQTSIVQFTPNSQTINMSSRAAAHSFITFVVSGNNDSLVTIVSNGDVQNAVNGLNNFFDFSYTLYSDSTSGDRYLTENYSSDFEAENRAFWSVSEILNYIVVREDDVINQPKDYTLDYAYPSPFEYEKSYLFGSLIFFPISVQLGEAVDFNVYTSALELVYKSEETIRFLPGERVGVTWNALDDNSEKLASGVYIYVIQKGDEITKGKVVIFN